MDRLTSRVLRISLLCLLMIIVGAWSGLAQAGSAVAVNPYYLGRYLDSSPQPLVLSERRASTPIECSSISSFIIALRDQMNQRNQVFSIHYTDIENSFTFAQVESRINSSLHQVLYFDDYLKFSYQGHQVIWSGSDNDVVIDFTVQYDTTAAQEIEITNRINQILLTIISAGMNDEEKAKAIHDWVVLNVAYDTTGQRHSIYDALFSGTAVCEGYALLMFRMLEIAGIPVHIIDGTGDGEVHAWNLVYLCSAWFHVDATWDDPIPDVPGQVRYNYYNLTDSQIAVDHTWDHDHYSSQVAGQLADTVYVEGICANQGYAKTYYIPYLSTDDYTARWTGLALANSAQQSCNVQVSYYSRSGTLLDLEHKTIPASGQRIFVAATPSGTEGWIKVEASTNLDGLALIGQTTPAAMYDMDMKATLHRRFLLSHLAADGVNWDSIVMACNPNNAVATLTYSYYNQEGQLTATRLSSIPVNGSVQDNLYNLFGQNLAGSMVIESSQPITAFMLYDSLTTTWKAGLSALPLD